MNVAAWTARKRWAEPGDLNLCLPKTSSATSLDFTCKGSIGSGDERDRLTSVPSTRWSPGFSSGLSVVQGPDCGHRIMRSKVDTPGHRSTEHQGDNRGADPKRLSPRSPRGLDGANLDEFRREWRRLYRSEPPRISRDLLVRGIGYRLQELQHGGLGKTTRRKLKTLAKMFRTEGRVAPDPGLSLKPGGTADTGGQSREPGDHCANASLTRLQRVVSRSSSPTMLTPKCPPRDFRVRMRAVSTKNSSLPLWRLLRASESGSFLQEIRRHYPSRTCPRSIRQSVAGAPGFEPGNHGIKTRCLTAWPRPNC